MREIEISVEKTIRVTKKCVISDEAYSNIITDGQNPCWCEMMEAIREAERKYDADPSLQNQAVKDGDIHYDYCIVGDNGFVLADWDE